MIRVNEYFEAIHSTESDFGEPVVAPDSIRIPALKLVLLGDHPLAKRGWRACTGTMVFLAPAKSTRRIVPYDGDPECPKGFLPERTITDLSSAQPVHGLRTFSFEGYSQALNAWIDEWKIEAGGFYLEVAEDGQVSLAGA